MSTMPISQQPDQTLPMQAHPRPMPSSDVGHYARIIFSRLWLIILLVLATEGAVAAISLTRPLAYETSVRFQITTLPPSDVTLYQTTRSTTSADTLAATRADFISVLTSLDVAWDTVDTAKLPLSGREVEQMVSVQQEATSDFIVLSVKANNPQLAANVANALIAAATKRYGELNAQPLTNSQSFIATQLDLTQKALDQARSDLTKFQADNSLGGLDAAISSQVTLIRSLEVSHDDAIAQGDQAKVTAYQNLIDQRRQELAMLINLSGQYDTLQSRVDQLKSTNDLLLGKMTEAQLKENEARNLNSVQVFGQARVPDQANPRISLALMVLSGAVALVLSVMLAFLWEYLALGQPKTGAAPAR